MEKSIKILFSAVLGLVLFNSCSKDNDDPKPENIQKKIAVELTYTGVDPSLSTALSMKVYGEDVSQTKVTGLEWNDFIVDENKMGIQFIGEVQPPEELVKTIRLETSEPVWGCTTITTFGPEIAEHETPIVVVVKYFIEDRLIKTDEFIPSAGNYYTYNEQMMVADN